MHHVLCVYYVQQHRCILMVKYMYVCVVEWANSTGALCIHGHGLLCINHHKCMSATVRHGRNGVRKNNMRVRGREAGRIFVSSVTATCSFLEC